jgi:hypothetical protein
MHQFCSLNKNVPFCCLLLFCYSGRHPLVSPEFSGNEIQHQALSLLEAETQDILFELTHLLQDVLLTANIYVFSSQVEIKESV